MLDACLCERACRLASSAHAAFDWKIISGPSVPVASRLMNARTSSYHGCDVTACAPAMNTSSAPFSATRVVDDDAFWEKATRIAASTAAPTHPAQSAAPGVPTVAS